MMKSPNNKCSLKNANEEIFKKICYFQITEVFRILEKKKTKTSGMRLFISLNWSGKILKWSFIYNSLDKM